MLLRNTREPYDTVEDSNEDRIAFFKERGYVEVEVEPFGQMTIRRNKKADQPPADLASLADELSKDAE